MEMNEQCLKIHLFFPGTQFLGHNFFLGHFLKEFFHRSHISTVYRKYYSWDIFWDLGHIIERVYKPFTTTKIMSLMSHILNLARKSGTFRDIFFSLYVCLSISKNKRNFGTFFSSYGTFFWIWADRTFFRHLWVFLVYW